MAEAVESFDASGAAASSWGLRCWRGGLAPPISSRDRRPAGRSRCAGRRSAPTILTRNATEAISLVTYAWGRDRLGRGDAVLIPQMEHHSNIVPWQLLCAERGAALRYLEVGDDGSLPVEQLDALPRSAAAPGQTRQFRQRPTGTLRHCHRNSEHEP